LYSFNATTTLFSTSLNSFAASIGVFPFVGRDVTPPDGVRDEGEEEDDEEEEGGEVETPFFFADGVEVVMSPL
jgi:hypothetical protein